MKKHILSAILIISEIFLFLFFVLSVPISGQLKNKKQLTGAIEEEVIKQKDEKISKLLVSKKLSLPQTPPNLLNKNLISSQNEIVTIISEGFEGSFPAGLWSVETSNYNWAKRNVTSHIGSNCAWAIGGGTIGSTLSLGAYYPNSLYTTLVYGPFDLSDANWASLSFYVSLNTESDYDYFSFMASDDGTDFYGYSLTGTTADQWLQFTLPLSAVPTSSDSYQNYTGKSSVWIAFSFDSDDIINYPNGVFLDDVLLQKGMLNVPTIVTSFPAPGSSSRGLTYDGTNLWCSDETNDRIYKLSTDGNIISSFASPGSIPSGLAWDGNNLWNTDINSARTYKLSNSGSILSSFSTPELSPSGLTWDGSNLWLSDAASQTIWQLSTNGIVQSTITAAGTYHYGLAWDGQNLWMVDADALLIYKLDNTGNVIDYYLTPATFPNGLVWDGNYFWLTDRDTDLIYKLEIASQHYANDVGIIGTELPNVLQFGNSSPVGVIVKNFGNNDQTNFPVSYRINNGTIITENYSGTLTAGTSATKSFSALWNPTTEGTYKFTAWSSLTGDEAAYNDTLPTPKEVLVRSNGNPELSYIGSQTVIAGQTKNVPISATDDDGDPLSFSIPTNPGFLSITDFSQAGNTATATLSISPSSFLSGIYNAEVQVSDGKGGLDNESLTIEVILPPPVGNWTKQNPIMALSFPFNSVYFIDTQTGWAVGGNGSPGSDVIYKTVDGGKSWICQNSGKSRYSVLRSVFFINSQKGWVVGNHQGTDDVVGPIVQTANGGTTWIAPATTFDKTVDFSDVQFVSDQVGWVIGNNGLIYKTTDGGVNWNTQQSNNSKQLHSLCFINDQIGWIAGADGLIQNTNDGGTTWLPQTSNTTLEISSIFFIDSQVGWAVEKNNPFLLRTTNGGKTWNREIIHYIYSGLESIYFIDAQTGWAAGHYYSINGEILKTTNGGNNWTIIEMPELLNSIFFVNSQVGYATGENGAFLSTEDGGTTWTNRSFATRSELWAAFFLDDKTGWAAGEKGTIIKTTNAGAAWNRVTTSNKDGINGLYFSDSKNGWACQNDGKILKTTNGGDSWNQTQTSTGRDFYGMYFLNSKIGWVVGGAAAMEGLVFKTTDGGNIWNSQGQIANQTLMDACFVNADTGWAIGMDGLIFTTTNGGTNWSSQTSGSTSWLTDICFINHSVGFIVGDGTVLKTVDGGKHWVEKGPLYGVAEEIFFIDNYNGWIVGTGQGVVKGIGGNDPGIHLLTGGTSKIWTTNDAGDTWNEDVSPNSGWLLSAYFTDRNSGWVMGDRGIVFKFSNSLAIPLPPTDLKAQSILSTQINLTWTDNSTNENGFSIYRSDAISGSYKLLVSVGENESNYLDTGLTTETTYWYKVCAYNEIGSSAKTLDAYATAGVPTFIKEDKIPTDFVLYQNYPNPFNPATTIRFSVPKPSNLKINIYTVLGEKVLNVVEGKFEPGFYKVEIGVVNLPSGIYIYRLESSDFIQTKKMILVK